MATLISVPDCENKQLLIVDDNITAGILNASLFTFTIDLVITYNCCNDFSPGITIVRNPDGTYIAETDDYKIEIINSEVYLYIKEAYFGADIPDGIYGVNIQVTSSGGTGSETNSCKFIDCVTKCKVASKIEDLLDCNEESDIFLLHYALSISDECYCVCDDLCELYNRLVKLLDVDNLKHPSNCGCC